MSDFREKATEVFPDVAWTGGSAIHVSHARRGIIPIPVTSIEDTLKLIAQVKFPAKSWEILVAELFPKMEWLIEEETFINLMMIDLGRTLGHQKTLRTPDNFTNPDTGNVFHRIALQDGYVGGFRCWATPNYEGFNIGWRFRIVKVQDDAEEVNIRETAMAQTIVVGETIHEVLEMMEVAESPNTTTLVSMEKALLEINKDDW